MTDKTPFDEFLDSVGFKPDDWVLIPWGERPSRADTLKAMWEQLVLLDAEHATAAMASSEDGVIVVTNDPWDEDATVEFIRVTYAGRAVIEAEGVVVCHLIG